MIGVIVSIVLFTGSLCIMIAAIIHNQITQTYESALGIGYAAVISVSTALLGLVISIVTHLVDKEMKLANRTMAFGFVYVATLVLIFSLVEPRMSP